MKNSNQTILVIGATGNQGGAVARHLLERGKFAVRALVLNENKPAAQALKQSGAELFKGDLNERTSLDSALEGVFGVFSVQGVQDGLDIEMRQGKTVADAAKAAGIEHLVYSSVGGAERKSGVAHFDSKFQIEEHIRAAGLPHTILRPVFFFFNYNRLRPMIEDGTLTYPLDPDVKLQQLSEEDYGKIAAEVFECPAEFLNREIEVASVELTMTETAAAFSRVAGKKVEYRQIPFEAFEQKAGRETTTMFQWFENSGYAADLGELKREFFAPTDLESYLREHGWAKRTASAPAGQI